MIKIEESKLGFGRYFTDHMIVKSYQDGCWDKSRIVPYAPFSLDPSTAVFHYGQAVFEGLKAYRRGGRVTMFRCRDNLKRLNTSCDRLCIPRIDEEELYSALLEFVRLEADCIPEGEGTSLYIRPCIIATENSLSVHSSKSYILFVIASPSGAYYANGLAPVRLLVEEHFVRASRGGTGHFKVAGNYAASLKAGEDAAKRGFDQVLWLDAETRSYIEEVGSMNMFFVRNGVVVTPSLEGSILPGITRDSVIKLLRHMGYTVLEERISIADTVRQIESGEVSEAFGTGTAAVISPVGKISYSGKSYLFKNDGEVSNLLYKALTDIQVGEAVDEFGWVEVVK